MPIWLSYILLYLIAIAVILIALTIHELGHFTCAVIFKINIKELSIGIGPRLFSWHSKKGIKYSLKLFPIMAYVLMDSHASRELYKDFREDFKYYYYMKPISKDKILLEDSKLWQYSLTMLMGIICNIAIFLIAWLILFLCGVNLNPFISLGQTFVTIGYNMAFLPSPYGGNIFTELAKIDPNSFSVANWALIFFNLFLMLNLMLAVLNILPIPPLDGYKMLSRQYVVISKKKISEKFESSLSLFFMLLMMYILVSSIIVGIIN